MEKKINKKQVGIALLVFVVLAAALGLLWWQFSEKPVQGAKEIAITVTGAAGEEEAYTLHTDAEYLKEAAETVLKIDGEETEYGFAVYSINGETADFNTGKSYWAIYVNGEYGNYSIDKQPLEDGGKYGFVLETYNG